MKKLGTLLTVAVLGCMGLSAGVAHAGNYRPINKQAQTGQLTAQDFGNTNTSKAFIGPQPATKTAFFYNSCYSYPTYGGYCSPCSSYYSPCGTRPYFPATTYYGGYGCGMNGCYGYGGYGVGGYGGYGMGGYGGYGVGGYGVGGYGAYGGYVNPGVAVPYSSPVINTPYLGGVGGYGGGFGGGYGGISPVSAPIYNDPLINGPFYP